MRLGYDLELVHHEYEDWREPDYWYFHYYGESVQDEKISRRYDSKAEAMQAYRDNSIEWEA